MSQVQQQGDGNNQKVDKTMMLDAIRAAGIKEFFRNENDISQLFRAITESKQNTNTEASDKSDQEFNNCAAQQAKKCATKKEENHTLSLKSVNLPNHENNQSPNEEPSQNTNYKESYASTARKSPQASPFQQSKFPPSSGKRNKRDMGPKSLKGVNFFANSSNEHDVPLKPIRSIACEYPPFLSLKDVMTNDGRYHAKAIISANLQKDANLWYSMNRLVIDDPIEILWHTPIKVGTLSDNLDKNSLIKDQSGLKSLKLDQKTNKTKRTRHTGMKRRAARELSSSDSDEELIFSIKKKKKEPKDQSNVYLFKDNSNDEDEQPHNSPASPACIEIEEFDDEIPPSPEFEGRNKKKQLFTDKPSPSSHSHNPKKLNFSKIPSKVLKVLNEENKTTIADDEKLSSQTPMVALEDIEIKRAKIPTRLSTRIKERCDILRKANSDEEQEKKLEERKLEENKRRAQLKKEERFKLKLQEEEELEEQQLQQRKRQFDKEIKYNELLKLKRIDGSSKAKSNKDTQQVVEIQDDFTFKDVENSVPCPICNECFPKDEIEVHASECIQFSPHNNDDNGIENSSMDLALLNCRTCDSFQTTDSSEFYEHVKTCVNDIYAAADAKSALSPEEQNAFSSPLYTRNNETSKLKDYSNRKRNR